MDPDVLFTFDRMPVLHGRKETPVSKRLQQQLVQSRVLRRSHERDIDRAVSMNGEAGERYGLIRKLAQVIGKHRQRMENRMGAHVAGRAGARTSRWTCR